MTTKEKIVRASIKVVERRAKKIQEIMDATPLIDIIEGKRKAQKLLENYKGEKRFSKEFMDQISELAVKEKKLFALARKQKDTVKLIDEKVKLDMELSDLKHELYFINNR